VGARHEPAWPAQLAAVALHAEPAFLADLAAAIRLHNLTWQQQQQQQQGQQQLQPLPGLRGASVPLTPLLLSTVRRTAAAVTIQACWRAHSDRRAHSIAERLLARRAACAIQAAWRACECPAARSGLQT
jgi:hypothetical protein